MYVKEMIPVLYSHLEKSKTQYALLETHLDAIVALQFHWVAGALKV